MTMTPDSETAFAELVETADRTPLTKSAILSLAESLPADDADLDAIIGKEIAAENARPVNALMLAAMAKGRPVDARHLAVAAHLLENPMIFGRLAFHCTGDVPDALCEAVGRGYMGRDRELCALIFSVLWQREHEGGELPDNVIRNARKIARNTYNTLETKILLVDLAVLCGNVDLGVILGFPEGTLASDDMLSPIVEGFKRACMGDLELFWTALHQGPKAGDAIPSGHPIHRVAPRISRNAPCPCGSGLKYKKCCIEKDRTREADASDIPGTTRSEIEANMERYLDADRIPMLRSHTLAALDPAKIDQELRYRVFSQLMAFSRLDAALNLLLCLPPGYDNTDMWWELILDAVAAGRTDIVGRLARFPVDDQEERERILDSFSVRYMLATPEQRELVDRLETEARKLLQPASHSSTMLAGELDDVSCHALAILAARAGIVEDIGGFAAEDQLEIIGRCRDNLLLPAADPVEKLLNARLDANGEMEEHGWLDEDLSSARDQVALKERELEEIRRQLSDARAQLDHHARIRERRLAQDSKKSKGAESSPSAIEKDLRVRISELKSTVGAFHSEKQQLLLKLRDVRQEAASRAMVSDEQTTPESPEPEAALEAFSELGSQPVRIPAFSAEFRKALHKVPQAVGARAMSMAGNLAAGDAKAFADARHLKLAEGQLRVRVGRAYRLLFRLEEDGIEFLKLIHRRDLERVLAR